MRTVLLVDGDTEKRQTLRLALEYAGYRVIEADGARAALALAGASQERLAVLLAQWMDPVESGRILAAAADDPAHLGRHHYLLLATCPRHIAAPLAEPMERLTVEVVRSPFDVNRLLAALRDCAAAPRVPPLRHRGVAAAPRPVA